MSRAMRVDLNNQDRFISLQDAGLEEAHDNEPLFGQYLCSEGSVYSYTEWFYDGDDSAFSII